MRGEYVAPSEMFSPRPTPEFEDFFEFDRPVASGLAPHARDLLVEDMLSPASGRAGEHVRPQPKVLLRSLKWLWIAGQGMLPGSPSG